MRVFVAVGASILVAMTAAAQETPAFKVSENPYQEELPFAVGQPVRLLVDVDGVRFTTLTVTPRGETKGGEVTCEVSLDGTNQRPGKVEVSGVLLLEDARGKGIERLPLEAFKAKGGKDFNESFRVSLRAETLQAAERVYVFLELK